MGRNSQYLTCVFKIHNPSAHKKAVMDYALEEYTLAYQALLDYAWEHRDHVAEHGMYRERYNSKAISRLLSTKDFKLHSSVKDSLLRDVGMNLASYFALVGEDSRTSWPTSRNFREGVMRDALDRFAEVGIEDFEELSADLLRKSRLSYMPVLFCRNDTKRNFTLLGNVKKRQLLALLYLLPAGHELGRPLGINGSNLYQMGTGEIFNSDSRCSILVPLEMGRNSWQEQKFLDPARGYVINIKTAYLVKADSEYFLHVAFEFPCPAKYEPETYLGVDRGILFSAAYALVDGGGAVLEMGHYDDELRALQIKHGREREVKARNGKMVTRRDYKTKAYNAILHTLANLLIEKALDSKAQIVLESLNIQVKGGRVVSRFKKLQKYIEYKAKLVGVPTREVFAAYSSMICHKCGAMMERDDRKVTCGCGYEGHSDDNAAVNIARRALYKKANWEKKGSYKAFHRSFANASTFTTE